MSALARLVPLAISAGFVASNGEDIQKVLDRSMDMAYQVKAKAELSHIRSQVTLSMGRDEIGHDLHEGNNFRNFIRESLFTATGEDSSLDPWGEPYRIRKLKGMYEVSSTGSDKDWKTDDDLWMLLPI